MRRPSGDHGPTTATDLTALVYELLDAHADTAELAGELVGDPRWDAHLDYLRALHRLAREELANGSREERA